MSYVIRVIALAAPGFPEIDREIAGKWIRAFDVDANGGRGDVKLTPDADKAMRFANFPDAMAAWRTQSSVRPLRDDGKPNRPLTAYTVEIDAAPSTKEVTS